jgi:diadenosine tetraphosphatase ApaH/serine/threonine PP2A family protein phosphatase
LPADLGNEYEIGPGKAIINVGSVGQPRDRNSRACYVLYDGGTAVFRRVEYDVDLAASQIYAVSELDDGLGERLLEGR